MTFEEYLAAKKIDSGAFRQQEPQRWHEYANVFGQVHPESFTTQKKFVINGLRRLYHLQPTELHTTDTDAPENKAAKPKPMMRPVAKKMELAAEDLPIKEIMSGEIVSLENTKPASVAESGTPAPKKPTRPVIRPIMKS